MSYYYQTDPYQSYEEYDPQNGPYYPPPMHMPPPPFFQTPPPGQFYVPNMNSFPPQNYVQGGEFVNSELRQQSTGGNSYHENGEGKQNRPYSQQGSSKEYRTQSGRGQSYRKVKDIEGVISMDMTEIKKKIMIGNLITDNKEMQDMREVKGMKKVKVVDMVEAKVMAINKDRVKEVKRVRGLIDMDRQFRIKITDTQEMGTLVKNIGKIIIKKGNQVSLKKEKTRQVMVQAKYFIKN